MEDPWADPTPPTQAVALEKPVLQAETSDDADFSSDNRPTYDSPTADFTSAIPTASAPASQQNTSAVRDFNDAEEADEDIDPYASSSIPPLSAPIADFADSAAMNDGFDEFDDFDEPSQAGPSGTSGTAAGGDDDFGDFDDFEEAAFEPAPIAEEPVSNPSAGVAYGDTRGLDRDFRALSLSSRPDPSCLTSSVHTLLSPLYPTASTSSSITSEVPREAPPLKQIMHSESSRDAYVQLCSPPSIKPLDWTRSQVRRDHLVSLGIPVNLDEVDSHRLSAMPMLSVETEIGRREKEREKEMERRYGVGNGPRLSPHGYAGGQRSASLDVHGRGARGPPSRPHSVHPGLERGDSYGSGSSNSRRQNGLGERPDLDMTRAEELCGIEEDQLTLLKPATLRKLRDDLKSITEQASARLAWEVQHKDSQTQDAATYNGMISDMIANAAKAKSAQQAGISSGGGVFRRSSARRPQSGTTTPGSAAGRIGSPAMR